MALNVHKRFRQGQILKLVTSEPISSQDELRRRLSLESQSVFLDCYNGRINVAGKGVHEARFHRAMANLGEKVKTLEKKGLK